MRKPFSILLLFVVVAMSFVAGCGGNDSTTPQNNTPPTFSKMTGASSDISGVVVTSDGLTVVAGEATVLDITGSTPLDGTGTSGVFVAGFKPDGSIAFRTFAAGSGTPSIFSMARDPDNNLLVTGDITNDLTFGTTILTHSARDVFIAKLDATGHPIWAMSGGGASNDDGLDIAASSDGSVYACGNVDGKALVAGEDTGVVGKQSGYLVKIQPAGAGVWRQTAVPDGTSECRCVAASQDGSVVVGGSYLSGNVTIGGVILPNDGVVNGFVARFDASGAPLGNIRMGGTGVVAPAELTTINDDVVVCGTFAGTADFDVNTAAGVVAAVDNDAFVARYSKTGELRWVKTFGTTGDQSATCVTKTSSGDLLVGGTFGGTFSAGSSLFNAAGASDIFIVRLSGSGTLRSAKRVSGSGEERPTGVASFNDDLIVAGTSGNPGELTFPDGTKRTPLGIFDSFVYQQP